MSHPALSAQGDGMRIAVKAVPEASRDAIAGLVGVRLKIRVTAPPEAGKANDAICRHVADALGVKQRQVTVVNGRRDARKTIEVTSLDPSRASSRLQ